MLTVYNLNEGQLNQLKEAYLIQLKEDEGVSYMELIESHDINDDIIFNHYEGVLFSEDDFF